MKKWRRSLIMILTSCLLLTACRSHSSAPAASVLPSDDNQEDGQVLTVINPSTPKAKSEKTVDPKQKYQIQTRLTDFRLLDGTSGIAWGLTRGELRIYMTEDNGVTWTNISPAATVQFSSPVQYGEDIFFLNDQEGWIIRKAQGSTESILLSTVDGGMNWKVSSLPDEINPASLYFMSKDRGWLMSTDSDSQGSQSKVLYLTSDGGLSWARAGLQSRDQAKDNQEGKIPNAGDFSGMTFTSLQQGYVLLQNPHRASLYATADSGRNWKAENLPVSQDLEQFDKHVAGPITTLPSADGQKTVAYIPLISMTESSAKYAAYFIDSTQPNEQPAIHFDSFSFPVTLEASAAEAAGGDDVKAPFAPVFLNDQEGWSLQGTTLYHTLDQGKTWAALTESRKLVATMEEYPEVVKLQFITPQLGWILIQNADKQSSRLLQTRDGGISWQML